MLIDADNVSHRYLDLIMSELPRHGIVTYRRIYGDFTDQQMAGWRERLLENAIMPMQQFSNVKHKKPGETAGKNATDSALIIDAMDILYEGNVDGFVIVSSDSDFTRLANRLRESAMVVVGMGRKNTATSFRRACTTFVNLDMLEEQRRTRMLLETDAHDTNDVDMRTDTRTREEPSPVNDTSHDETRTERMARTRAAMIEGPLRWLVSKHMLSDANATRTPVETTPREPRRPEVAPAKASATDTTPDEHGGENADPSITLADVESVIAGIVRTNDGKGRPTTPNDVWEGLRRKFPDFDVRMFGYTKLTRMLDDMPRFRMTSHAHGVRHVKLANAKSNKAQIREFVLNQIKSAPGRRVQLSKLASAFRQEFPSIEIRDLGYAQFWKFVSAIDDVYVDKNHQYVTTTRRKGA